MYQDFKTFLRHKDRETLETVEQFLGSGDRLWSKFEQSLANLDVDALLDVAAAQLTSYGDDDWSDSAHHDFQWTIEQTTEALSTDLKKHFCDWIRHLDIPTPATVQVPMLRLYTEATFLNFNYTSTLTRLYGVPLEQVTFIHGDAAGPCANLVLGHNYSPKSLNDSRDMDAIDPREAEGNEIIDQYFRATFKPVSSVIHTHRDFFKRLALIQDIFVLGHSLDDVDIPYFKEIMKNIDGQRTKWKISYYRNENLRELREQFQKLPSVPGHLVEYLQLAEL